MKNIVLVIAFFLLSIHVLVGQSAKKYFKTAEKQFEQNQLDQAKASLTESLKLDPNLVDAYMLRARVYAKTNELDLAIADLDMANKLQPDEKDIWLCNGDLNFQKKDFAKASSKYGGYLMLDSKNLTVYDKQILSLQNIERYDQALSYAQKKLAVKETSQTFYQIANLQYILKQYTLAEQNYRSALKDTPNNIDYHNGLAQTLNELGRFDAGIGETNIVLRSDMSNKAALLTRAKCYHKKIEYSYAINDMSKVILTYPNDDDYLNNLNYRGDLYLEFSQHMNAVADYSKVLGTDPDNIYALQKRAQAYEEITRGADAQTDLTRILALAAGGALVSEAVLSHSKNKLYELRRETTGPTISLADDFVSDNKIRTTFDNNELTLTIKVKDENEVEEVFVEGKEISAELNKGEVTITETVAIAGKESVEIKARDTYGNNTTTSFTIMRVENAPPLISFMTPFTNENGEMILDQDDSRVYFEGNITDESLIKSISIDDVLVPFNRDEQNPVFSTNLDLREKIKIMVVVADIYDNKVTKEFILNREAAVYAEQSPMGKTWVVFIENSKYQSFASLDGPVKDVRLMKSALANYEIHNFIHRTDMTKAQMERFFSIELRDMVKKNNVNSLVVWYAGHGKLQNETGYWIPVDADRTDEFSYYNINNLKASMQVYAKELTHTLVITDACESGPSFYQAMRSQPQVRNCSDENAVKFKSSQVLSSAGYELASDNSQFTKTFANSLINNSAVCIPIESIVLKVGNAVTKDNQQKPQFGKIAGLIDEDGTFFFIKRAGSQTNAPQAPKK
jgi:tetratricopeptide (TPR) repeat protein